MNDYGNTLPTLLTSMKHLIIEWKHFDKNGKTCDRCSDTGKSLKRAAHKLQEDFGGRGVKITVKKILLAKDKIAQSNTLYFNSKPFEDVLAGMTVSSRQCESCSCLVEEKVGCRTIHYQGKTFEEIPEELIRSAALKVMGEETR